MPSVSRFQRQVLVALALGAIVCAVAAFYLVPLRQRQAEWRAALPSRPDLASWPKALGERIQNDGTRLKRWPPDTAALGDLARVYLANGFNREAEQVLRALIPLEPKNAHWPYALATTLANAGGLEEAVRYWNEAVALEPDYLPARLKSADALRKLNRSTEAEQAYLEVLRLAPANVYALAGLVVMDMEAGNWTSAKSRVEAMVAADPNFWSGFSLLATVANHFGDADLESRARKRADQLGRFKDTPDPWTDELSEACYDVYRLQVVASTLATTGSPRAALAPLLRAAELSPDDGPTRRQLGKTYLILNDAPHAEEQLQRALNLEPSEPTNYVEMEKVFKARNDVAGAAALLRRGLERCPAAPALHYEYALVLVAQGQAEEAVPHLERARDLAPGNAGTYENLSMTYARLGKVDEGLAALEAGLAHDPNNGPLIMLKGRYALQAGRETDAQNAWRRARELGAPEANSEEFAQLFLRRFGRRPE